MNDLWSERDSKICEHCGAPSVEHDYQQLARECYPKQIARLHAREAELVRALTLMVEIIDRADPVVVPAKVRALAKVEGKT